MSSLFGDEAEWLTQTMSALMDMTVKSDVCPANVELGFDLLPYDFETTFNTFSDALPPFNVQTDFPEYPSETCMQGHCDCDKLNVTTNMSTMVEQQPTETADQHHHHCGTEAANQTNMLQQSSPVLRKKTPLLQFVCAHCPKRCTSEENLKAHLRTHIGLKPFTCIQCDRSFNKFYNLTVHMRDEHNGNHEIICAHEGCERTFKREGSYKMHLRLKHCDKKPVWRTYVCEACGRIFKNITTLKEHRYKHGDQEKYPYHCQNCGKRYTSQRTYKEHLLRHAGIKNFECPFCGLKKTTRNELRTHINYHTKEKQWKCPFCPSVFNNSANLGMHDRIVHKGIRRYLCRYCDLSFGKADTLKHHEMRHTGEKPHKCHLCDKRFIQAVALKAHLKVHLKQKSQ